MYTYNKVRPKGYSAAMMWRRYNSESTWDWIQIRYWPKDIAEAVINKKLKYATRFRVMIYLVGNGMDPAQARNEVLKMGLGYFDASARQHVRDLYRDLSKNAHKWSYWDERERRILALADTGFVEKEKERVYLPRKSWKETLDDVEKDAEKQMELDMEDRVERAIIGKMKVSEWRKKKNDYLYEEDFDSDDDF